MSVHQSPARNLISNRQHVLEIGRDIEMLSQGPSPIAESQADADGAVPGMVVNRGAPIPVVHGADDPQGQAGAAGAPDAIAPVLPAAEVGVRPAADHSRLREVAKDVCAVCGCFGWTGASFGAGYLAATAATSCNPVLGTILLGVGFQSASGCLGGLGRAAYDARAAGRR